MKGIDFTQINKKYLEIKLRTGIVIHILPPSVAMCGELQTIGKDIDSVTNVLSRIMSHNKQFIKVTKEDIAEYDIEDIFLLVTAIQEFVTEIANEKH